MTQVCSHCGHVISYQRACRLGLCAKCEDGRGYRMRSDIPGGLYAPVFVQHGRVIWNDSPILFSHEVKAMLKADCFRIGQILERWYPTMPRRETGELFQVADRDGELVLVNA